MIYDFSSDTTAPVSQEIMGKLKLVNKGCEVGYSEDRYTKQVRKIVQSYFTKPVGIHMCAHGSASNVLAVKIMKHNYSSIICCDNTHCNRYEVGGTEYNTGCKIITCQSSDGKLTVDMIKSKLLTKGNYNWALPEIVVLSQPTELGVCYTCEELKNICDFCHKNDLYVYIDGARLGNAMVHENCSFKEMLEDTGVDIASFGINKNGAMFGEMLLILNKKFNKNFMLEQKQSMQLFSKTRFLSAQFLAMFENDLWKRNATHSNKMALYFSKQLKKLGKKILFPVHTNCIYIRFNKKELEHLRKRYAFNLYDEDGFTRLMTSWITTKEEIDEFVSYLKQVI